MAVRLTLQYACKASHAFVCAEPWIRLLAEVDTEPCPGHAISARGGGCGLILRKLTNTHGIIDAIDLTQTDGTQTRHAQKYLNACTWWLCKPPFSAHRLSVKLHLTDAVDRLITPTSFHVTHLQMGCATAPSAFHRRLRVRTLQRAYPQLVSLEIHCGALKGSDRVPVGATTPPWSTLRHLSLSVAKAKTLLPHIPFTSLETLSVCTPDPFPSASISLHGAARLRELRLSRLSTDFATLLTPAVAATLTNLASLEVSYCDDWRDLTPLVHLKRLTRLCVHSCGVQSLGPLRSCAALHTVDVKGCSQIQDLTPLREMCQLTDLNVSCTRVTSLAPLRDCHRLTTLTADECRELTTLSPLAGGATYLTTLSVCMCDSLVDLAGLGTCEQLTHLNAAGCHALHDVSGLTQSLRGSLRSVNLNGTSVTSLAGFGQCRWLEKVQVCHCRALVDLSGLAQAPHVHTIDASDSALVSVEGLGQCPSLQQLVLAHCGSLRDLRPLTGAPSLEQLDVTGTAITSLDGLASCPRLASVRARGCTELRSLTGIAGAPKLRTLNVSESPVSEIGTGIATCPALHELRMRGCLPLSDITPLRDVPSLRVLDVADTAVCDVDGILSLLPQLVFVFVSAEPPDRDDGGRRGIPTQSHRRQSQCVTF